jgi:transmembrane sensor
LLKFNASLKVIDWLLMDYTKFNVEELASNESFIDWVKQSDPEAVRFWDAYLATHPEIRPTVEKARALVHNLKLAEEMDFDPSQVETIWRKLEDRLAEPSPAPRSVPPVLRLLQSRWTVAAACITVLGAALAFWLAFPPVKEDPQLSNYYQQHSDFIEQVNETDRPLRIQLADGSVALLDARSRLKYRPHSLNDSTRQVYLLGNAFFEVVKNPYKPFIVHSNEIDVKVLGTSFRVESPENGENVLVSVKTGKVSVYAAADEVGGDRQKGGVILLPNQQVRYERSEHLFEKTLVESPEVLGTAVVPATDFVFENAPIADVFRTLETAYGIEILFNEEVMRNCYVTVPLGAESMREKLKIVCQTIGASYEIIDVKVVINSSGCP